MGVVDAPQWLLPAYVRSVRALGATAPVERIRRAGERLVQMWSTPDRRFHNLRHAIDMLARVDELADESHNPDVMRLAAWYHGCIFSAASEQTYRRNGGEDEVASAAYAARDLRDLGVPDRITDRVCALILNLKRHNLARDDIDALALNDADLGALAVEPQQYKRYRQLVREEYAHIPDEDYLRARLAIVSRLLDRDALFSSPLGTRWESPARQNLEAEKQRLIDCLAKLPPRPAAVEGADAGAPRAAEPAGAGSGQARPEQAALGGLELAGEEDAPAGASPTAPEAGSPAPVMDTSRETEPDPPAPPAQVQRRPPVAPAQSRSRPERDEAEEARTHTTSMESCIEDLDRLMGSRRSGPTSAAADRQAAAASERSRLAERLRLKAQEAKIAREARTGEMTAISSDIVDDSASRQ